jgi:outer membrane protein assembly factor BamB
MKIKHLLIISTLLLLSVFISACSSSIYASTGWYGLTANSSSAFVAAGTQVYAVDLNTGSEQWRYPAKASSKITFYANPVLTSDGQLLVASYDHKLYSINPATGAENWIFSGSKNRLIASPLTTDTMIYQPSADNNLYAIDLSGKQIWVQQTEGPIWAKPAAGGDCGCLYVPSMDHFVYAFDENTGKLLWKSEDLQAALVGTPAVSSDGLIFVGTFGKEMIALNASDGTVKWRFTTQDWVWSGPALENNIIYFGDLSGYLYALNTSDGSTVWRIQPQNGIVDRPVVMSDKLYFTTEADSLYAVSTAGDILFSKPIGGVIYSAPVIVGDTILVAPSNFDSLLVALNLDGNQKWTYTPGK